MRTDRRSSLSLRLGVVGCRQPFPQPLLPAACLLLFELDNSYVTHRDLRLPLDERAEILGDPVSGPPHGLLGSGWRVKEADGDHLLVADLQDIVGTKA